MNLIYLSIYCILKNAIITPEAASRFGCTAHCPAQQALARR